LRARVSASSFVAATTTTERQGALSPDRTTQPIHRGPRGAVRTSNISDSVMTGPTKWHFSVNREE
jgi:hypothetical protein